MRCFAATLPPAPFRSLRRLRATVLDMPVYQG